MSGTFGLSALVLLEAAVALVVDMLETWAMRVGIILEG